MKANAPFVPNKKLILHFDIDCVIRIPSQNKDFYVYELCAAWVWGKLQKSSKQQPEKVTGWKIANNALTIESPEPQLISYKSFLDEYIKPSPQEYEKLITNLSKGPAAKAKSEIEKNIKNITLPKALFEAMKELNEPQNHLLARYLKDGKYQILPAFYKLIMSLKKAKRQFAIMIYNNNPKDNHQIVLQELNLFFSGEHPLFNGKNGTPLIKMDGSKGVKNFIIEQSHQTALYCYSQKDYFSTFGTINYAEQKDSEMFKQKFKSFKTVKLCENPGEIYSVSHAILAQAACIYEINPLHAIFIDPVDYLTHQIYFTASDNPKVFSCLGDPIKEIKNFVVKIAWFDFLKDVDYFMKQVEALQGGRVIEIEKTEKGQIAPQQEEKQEKQEKEGQQRESDSEYLKKHLLPVLEGALKQVDLFRPSDPLGFIALYCLKNKDRLE